MEILPLKKGFSLRNVQIQAIDFMTQRESITHHGIKGGILMMKQGLGKSLTVIAHSLLATKTTATLIIASKTVMQTWLTDGFHKFFGDNVNVLYLHQDITTKNVINKFTPKRVSKYDFVVTTYDVCVAAFKKGEYAKQIEYKLDSVDLCVREIRKRSLSYINSNTSSYDSLFNIIWDRIICDESQTFVNPKTLIYKSMMTLCGKHFWCLSGTPIKNGYIDLWSQFRFLGYTTIAKPKVWEKEAIKAMKVQNLCECIFSRDYIQAGISLTKKRIHTRVLALTEKESVCYEFVMSKIKVEFDSMLKGLVSFVDVLVLFTRLRQLCIAPWLMTSQSKRTYQGNSTLVDECIVDKDLKKSWDFIFITKKKLVLNQQR